MTAAVSIVGVGVSLPQAYDVRELALTLGADVSGYRGWTNVCLAADGEHPSTLAAAAVDSALADAGIGASDLRLVISTGVSRDYPPSWSLATEVMRLVGVPDNAFGFDLTSGCMGTLVALNLVHSWLSAGGGGHAAIVSAERWSSTVDRNDPSMVPMWAHGDAGGALIVGVDVTADAKAVFEGAVFCSRSELNGHVLVRYGGTRHPTAPPGRDALRRELGPTPGTEVSKMYQAAYDEVFASFRRRFDTQPERLVCNQISPGIVAKIAGSAGVPIDRTIVTGNATGHLGSVDVVAGLRALMDAGPVDGPVALASSVAHAFGAGLLVAPGRHVRAGENL